MASEMKRPARPFRRKSDIPLDSNRFLDEKVQQKEGGETKSPGIRAAVSSESPEVISSGNDAIVLEDCSLQIVEDWVNQPVQPIQSCASGLSAHSSSRQARPRERHKTLSSQFPTVELREKNEREWKVDMENKEHDELLQAAPSATEKRTSLVIMESSSQKPLIKPKPQFHGTGQQSTIHGQQSGGQQSQVLGTNQQSIGQQSSALLTANQQDAGLRSCTHTGSSGDNISDPKSKDQLSNFDKNTDHQSTNCHQQQNTAQHSTSLEIPDHLSQQNTSQQSSCLESIAKKSCDKKSSSSQEMNENVQAMQSCALSDDAELSTVQSCTAVAECQGQEASDIPVYATVDRTKKAKSNLVSEQDHSLASNQLKMISESSGNPSDLVSTSGNCSVAAASTSMIPPKKPPRTFAHTEYLRLKSAERERQTGTSVSAITESDYEEIEHPTMRSGSLESGTKTEDVSSRNSFSQSDSTKAAKCDSVKRRSTGDKLPAPPRPPPPSIVQKTATPPSKKGREISPSFEAFQRGPLNFRNSDRGFWEKRKSASPESAKAETLQKKANAKKANVKKTKESKIKDAKPSYSGKAEEDIYAEPNEIKSSLVSQSSVESPIDDPLYEVPAMANKSQFSAATTDAVQDVLKKPAHQPTQRRISSAYSILRLNIESAESNHDNLETVDEDSDAEVTKDEQERRLKHISNVRKRTTHLVANYVRVKLNETNQLYDFALIVGLCLDENKKCHPEVLFQYPEKLSNGLSAEKVELFCFPDAEIWRPVTIYDGEMFSFVLTNQLGLRQYGYCRRLLPPGSGNRLPAAICIVSSISEVCIYEQLLRSVEDRFLVSEEQAKDLLRAAYSHLCPEPNREVFIITGPECRKQPVILRRAGESRPDVVSCDALLTYLSTNILIKVFGSVLLERRLIFCAQKLGTLTSCVHTILSLLYPFEWQHVFVPVLPSCMTEVLDSPTPFVIGILSSTYAKLLQNEALSSEILVVDLDGGSLLRSYGDEGHIIPEKLQKALSSALKDDGDSIGVRDTAVTEAFLRFFVETCGHYTDFISTRQDGKLEFNLEQFTGAVASRSIQMFLEWFARTQMFEVFMTEELHGMKHDLFLSRIMEYREEMTEMTSSLKLNMKLMRKKIKHFFVESGGKLRRKFQRNVFI